MFKTDLKKKKEPVLCLTVRCNQRCLFCSRGSRSSSDSPDRIKELVRRFPDTICIEGGEPVLGRSLLKWVAYAKERGTRNIMLVTNGLKLEDPGFARSLLDAGVTMFNVNFPAHNGKLSDLITRTRGNFEKRTAAVKNLISVAGPGRVRLTLVVNSIMAGFLPQYARFITRAFPGLFYAEFNMIKVLGYVRKRPWLVPRLAALRPKLAEAFRVLDRGGTRFLTDGFPLCAVGGYEDRAIDVFKLAYSAEPLYLKEKKHGAVCARCSLKGICPGPRADYLDLYGPSELRPSKKDPGPIVKKAARQLG